MEALRTIFLWPLSVVESLLTVACGSLIAAIPLLLRVVSKGTASLKKFNDLFAFFEGLPLGQQVFSSIVYLFAPYSTNTGLIFSFL
jgi:hypothetical protein